MLDEADEGLDVEVLFVVVVMPRGTDMRRFNEEMKE